MILKQWILHEKCLSCELSVSVTCRQKIPKTFIDAANLN